MQHLKLTIHPDAEAAIAAGYNYHAWETMPVTLNIEEAVIVRDGTQEGNSTVDLILTDIHGNKYVAIITASLLNMVGRVTHAS